MINVVIGPPCAGKSTYVAEHSRSEDVVVDFDRLAAAISGGDHVSHDPTADVKDAAYKARAELIDHVLTHGGWLIHSRPKPEQIERYREAGAEFTLLNPGLEECLARAEKDGRPDWTSDAIHAWFDNPPQIEESRSATMTATGLEIREMKVRAVDTEKREVTGIAVPYGQVANIAGVYREEIAPGAVQDSDGAKFFYGHSEPIGRVTEGRDTKTGWEITAHISETARGDEVYTLLRDGVLDRLSIGFEPVEHTETFEDDGSLTITRTKIRVHEVSAVPFPAYDGAEVTAVRTKQQPTTQGEKEVTDTGTATADLRIRESSEFRALSESVDDLTRRLETLDTTTPQTDAGPQFRSFGDYVKSVASGDETALRAYEGATTGDAVVKDAWVGNLVKIIGEKQKVKNSFSTGPLPAEGMKVEYAQLKEDTTKVEKQSSQGDDLAFGKVSIEVKSGDVETFGGYSTLSRQAIERSSVGILDTTFTAMAVKYAKAVENKTRSIVDSAHSSAHEISLAADPTDSDWLETLISLAERFEDVDATLSGLYVSKDVFISLAQLPREDRFLQIDRAPANHGGEIRITSLEADLAGIPVKWFPGWSGTKALAYDPFAIKTLDSPGAPLRLQDENIVNLSKDFSVYGYASAFIQAQTHVAKIKFESE